MGVTGCALTEHLPMTALPGSAQTSVAPEHTGETANDIARGSLAITLTP